MRRRQRSRRGLSCCMCKLVRKMGDNAWGDGPYVTDFDGVR